MILVRYMFIVSVSLSMPTEEHHKKNTHSRTPEKRNTHHVEKNARKRFAARLLVQRDDVCEPVVRSIVVYVADGIDTTWRF